MGNEGGYMRDLFLAAALALAVYSALAGAGARRREAPEAYVISLQKRRDFEKRDVWYLQYALGGRIEQAVFYTPGGARDYLEYLKKRGAVFEGEETP
jgi:hypothetical protein